MHRLTDNGYGPEYASGLPRANSHQVAANAGSTCNFCHNTTTSDGVSISSKSTHVNNNFGVDAGGGASFSYTFAATGGTCANVSCHTGGTNRVWGSL